MTAPNLDRIATSGWYGDSVTRFESIVTNGWYGGSPLVLVLSDSLSFTDSAIKGAGKELSDTFSITDSVVMTLGEIVMILADSFGITDSLTFAVSLGFAEQFDISDTIVKSVAKAVADALTISDAILSALAVFSRDMARTLAEPFNETDAWMPYIAIGSSDEAGIEWLDNQLYGEIHRKAGEVYVIRNTYFVKATFGQDEPTGDSLSISEIGIFDDPVSGQMGKRWVLDTPVSKDNIDEIIAECAVTMLHAPAPLEWTFTDQMDITDSVLTEVV